MVADVMEDVVVADVVVFEVAEVTNGVVTMELAKTVVVVAKMEENR